MTILESLIAEAREQAVGHPSKDARFFAASVLKYLTAPRGYHDVDEFYVETAEGDDTGGKK
jgi:hypothetical protein